MNKNKNRDLHVDIAKAIKEPITIYKVPPYLKENTEVEEVDGSKHSYIIKAKKVTYIDGNGKLFKIKSDKEGICEMPFCGLNSDLEYVTIEESLGKTLQLDKVRIQIATIMDERETNLLKLLKKKTIKKMLFWKRKNKYFIFIKRYISKEIAKLFGCPKKEIIRAVVVNPCPVLMGDTNQLAYGVYGYESYIIALVEE